MAKITIVTLLIIASMMGMVCAQTKEYMDKCKAQCIPYCQSEYKRDWGTCNFACEVVCANRKDVFFGHGPPAIVTRLKHDFHPPPQ